MLSCCCTWKHQALYLLFSGFLLVQLLHFFQVFLKMSPSQYVFPSHPVDLHPLPPCSHLNCPIPLLCILCLQNTYHHLIFNSFLFTICFPLLQYKLHESKDFYLFCLLPCPLEWEARLAQVNCKMNACRKNNHLNLQSISSPCIYAKEEWIKSDQLVPDQPHLSINTMSTVFNFVVGNSEKSLQNGVAHVCLYTGWRCVSQS